eukprot:scaffold22492_cov33-Tisochrysis_lutea.AAC.4
MRNALSRRNASARTRTQSGESAVSVEGRRGGSGQETKRGIEPGKHGGWRMGKASPCFHSHAHAPRKRAHAI